MGDLTQRSLLLLFLGLALARKLGLDNKADTRSKLRKQSSRSARSLAASAAADSTRGVTLVVNSLVVRLPLEGVVDLTAEAARLRAERDDCLRSGSTL